MSRTLQYYKQSNIGTSEHKILISGQCPMVKSAYLGSAIREAASSNYIAVIIDYSRSGDFSEFFRKNGFSKQRVFVTERDNYNPLTVSIHTAINNLRTHAQRLGYGHSEYAMMTAFLDFLNNLEEPSEKSSNVQQLLRKFRNQEKLEEILISHIKNHKITREDAQADIQTYLEYAKSGITVDILLNELGFITTPIYEKTAFSFSDVRLGEAVILYASENNSTDINSYMTRLWTNDILELSKHYPILLAINSGHHSQIERTYELVETLAHKDNVNIVYCSYDLFSGVDVNMAAEFTKIFNYNLYGVHTGDSAEYISRLFGEHWITQYSYTDTRNQRILSENILDRILKTDRSTSIVSTPIRERVFPPERIMNMSQREYIIFDIVNNLVESMYI